MLMYAQESNEYEKARRLCLDLIKDKGKQHHYLILFKCDQAIGDNPERPYELTLDYASEK